MLPGERQIKDGVSFDDVVGISVMFDNEDLVNEVAFKIKDILQKYNRDIPIYDREFNQIEFQNIRTL